MPGRLRSRSSAREGHTTCGAVADLAHEELVCGDQRERWPRSDDPASYRWFGHCDIGRQARTLPTTSNARGRTPPRLPDRESESNVVEAATIMPSTDSGVSTATQPGWPCSATSMHMEVRDDTGDESQQPHASGRRPPDPLVGTPAHRAPRTSSPMSAGMYIAADSDLGPVRSP